MVLAASAISWGKPQLNTLQVLACGHWNLYRSVCAASLPIELWADILQRASGFKPGFDEHLDAYALGALIQVRSEL